MITIWYLIIFNVNGGLVSVPQPSKEVCVQQAKQLDDYSGHRLSYCVQGLKP